MAQTIRIRRGTKAELVARGALLAGEMGFCTDTKEVYVGDGTANTLVGRVMTGPYASRPSAAVSGRYYFVTGGGANNGYLYLDDGALWVRMNALELSDLNGTLDNIAEGATYGRVKKTDLTGGSVNKVSDGTKTATAAQIRDHIDDATKHRVINDSGSSVTDLWSAQKIKNELDLARAGQEYQDSVKDKDLATPPASPAAKDRYIVGASPTGVWTGKVNNIAEWTGSAWSFIAPTTGMTCIVDDESKQYTYNGTSWVRTGGALQTITAGNGLTGGGTAETVTLTVGAGNGITVGPGAVSAKAGKGVLVNATGIETNIDADSIVYDAANGNRLMVAAIDGGTF
ncbi:DUF2793 domain-containing protein [Paenibacillus contaminans]|uniref:Major tropism determinant N-terminal domain-containing protein n=1 Tax=Paenibacillus contaminans TaxID=450362 RepID=A0A329MIQ6_9BACL|nr:DUF2793 domain-containing protein [Paenibacillus contaminans]RAV19719.1 hypothetical protein DQG23_19925 [Paenibacillus contaminans]